MNSDHTIPGVPAALPDWLAPHVEEVAGWGPAPAARGCWVLGCRRDAHLHGLCKTHALRAQRAWNPRPSQERYRRAQPDVVPASDSETDHSITKELA